MSAEFSQQHDMHDRVHLPAPTPWPLVLALGITLGAAGLITNLAFCAVGAVLIVAAIAGWIGELATDRGSIDVAWLPADERTAEVLPAQVQVETLLPGAPGHRLRVPEMVHPYSAGVRGGLVGGVAMAVTALAYGVVSGHGVWYPINLLAAMVLTGLADKTTAELEQYSAAALAAGAAIHLLTSLAVGLCYGIILPTLPRWPMLWGGLAAPLLWTGATYGFMGILNPVMNARVEWTWFFVSQFVFGLTAGAVVARSEKVPAHKPRGGRRLRDLQDRRS